MPLPAFTDQGDLPAGVHRATLHECLDRLGSATPRRRMIASRLKRIHEIAVATGAVARFVIFGSFVSTKAQPNDVDVFLLMGDSFDVAAVTGEAKVLFNHEPAQAHFGASVFWMRRISALDGEQATIEHWQIKRDGTKRGIVDLTLEAL